jgi:hypothetical protein
MVHVIGCGKTFVTPYWVHELSNYAVAILPSSVYDRVSTQAMESIMKAGDPERYEQITEARAKGRYLD